MSNCGELKPSTVFTCEKIDDVCRDLDEKVVTFVKELKDMPWGKFVSFQDTEGNEIGLKG